jgi:hypothetical protein
MNKNIEVVILTKSIKNGGYCVAGIDINTSKWVRLVSSDRDSHGALFEQDIQYRNGMNCEPLDVARVPILRKMPTAYQPENVLIDECDCQEKSDPRARKILIHRCQENSDPFEGKRWENTDPPYGLFVF